MNIRPEANPDETGMFLFGDQQHLADCPVPVSLDEASKCQLDQNVIADLQSAA